MGSCLTVNVNEDGVDSFHQSNNEISLFVDDSFLIYGYIRAFENTFPQYIIPEPVYCLCYKYCSKMSLIYFFSSSRVINPNWLNALDLDDNKINKLWKCNIYELNNPDMYTINASKSEMCAVKYAGLASKNNIKLPNKLHNKMVKLYQNKLSQHQQISMKNNYNLIFKCGGVDIQNWSNAVILNEYQFHGLNKSETNQIIGFNWSLPHLNKKVEGNSAIFIDDMFNSNYYGLLSIAGYEESIEVSSNMYYLPFDDDLVDATPEQCNKWKQLSCLNQARTSPTCVFIQSSKLMVVGGYNGIFMNSNEIYSFNDDKWIECSSMKQSRTSSAILYDNKRGKVYVGGGYSSGSLNCVEEYDINKDKWSDLPSTNVSHDDAIFWMRNNDNVLCIASVVGNTIETIDLRQATKWESDWETEHFKTLNQLFDALYVESGFGINRFCM